MVLQAFAAVAEAPWQLWERLAGTWAQNSSKRSCWPLKGPSAPPSICTLGGAGSEQLRAK